MSERGFIHDVAKLQAEQVDVYVLDLEQGRALVEMWEGGASIAAKIAAHHSASAIDTAYWLREIAEFIRRTWRSARIEYVIRTYTRETVLVLRAGPGFRQVMSYARTVVSVEPTAIRFAVARVAPVASMQRAVTAIKSGGVLTVVLVTAFNVIDHLMRDELVWQQLAARVAADLVTIGASVAVSTLAVSLIGGMVAAFAFGPLGVAIAAGLATTFLLERFEVGSRIARALEQVLVEISARTIAERDRLQSEWRYWNSNPFRQLYFWERVFGMRY